MSSLVLKHQMLTWNLKQIPLGASTARPEHRLGELCDAVRNFPSPEKQGFPEPSCLPCPGVLTRWPALSPGEPGSWAREQT